MDNFPLRGTAVFQAQTLDFMITNKHKNMTIILIIVMNYDYSVCTLLNFFSSSLVHCFNAPFFFFLEIIFYQKVLFTFFIPAGFPFLFKKELQVKPKRHSIASQNFSAIELLCHTHVVLP